MIYEKETDNFHILYLESERQRARDKYVKKKQGRTEEKAKEA
jgi:hypothetical protein